MEAVKIEPVIKNVEERSIIERTVPKPQPQSLNRQFESQTCYQKNNDQMSSTRQEGRMLPKKLSEERMLPKQLSEERMLPQRLSEDRMLPRHQGDKMLPGRPEDRLLPRHPEERMLPRRPEERLLPRHSEERMFQGRPEDRLAPGRLLSDRYGRPDEDEYLRRRMYGKILVPNLKC